MSTKRIGKFSIAWEVMDQSWESLLPVMSNFVVIEATANYATRTIDYTAMSSLFDEVASEFSPPHYILDCSKQEDGSIKLVGVRQTTLIP